MQVSQEELPSLVERYALQLPPPQAAEALVFTSTNPLHSFIATLAGAHAGWDSAPLPRSRLAEVRRYAGLNSFTLQRLDDTGLDATVHRLRKGEPSEPDERCEDGRLLFLTSGTTGRPKFIPFTTTQVRFLVEVVSSSLGYQTSDLVLSAMPIGFDYGFYQLLIAEACSASVVLHPNLRMTGDVAMAIRDLAPSVLPLTPAFARRLCRALEDLAITGDSVRLITSTGAPLSVALQERLRRSFPKAAIVPMYGLTECKRVSILAPQAVATLPTSVGTPLEGTNVRIILPDGGEAPPGEPGEAVVTGPHVAHGYWMQPVGSPFVRDGSGEWSLRTGDRMHKDREGYLFFHARLNRDLVKVNDERVSLIALEEALRSHSEIIDATVIPRTDKDGLIDQLLVRVASKEPIDHSDMRAHILRVYPTGALEQLRFEHAIEITLNDHGKVDTRPHTDAEIRQEHDDE